MPLYKAFIEAGASEESATKASEDVIQVSQLSQLATKPDIAIGGSPGVPGLGGFIRGTGADEC